MDIYQYLLVCRNLNYRFPGIIDLVAAKSSRIQYRCSGCLVLHPGFMRTESSTNEGIFIEWDFGSREKYPGCCGIFQV